MPSCALETLITHGSDFGEQTSPSKECTSYFMQGDKEWPVIVIEMNHQSIPWTEPRDLLGKQSADAACDPHGFAFGLSDGSVGRGDRILEIQ